MKASSFCRFRPNVFGSTLIIFDGLRLVSIHFVTVSASLSLNDFCTHSILPALNENPWPFRVYGFQFR